VRPSDDDRASQRHCYDDPRVGMSHDPPSKARGEFDDFCHRLEVVLHGVPERMWAWI
jgi:hypothetical protein